MTRFFRPLRKRLLHQNKVTRYFLYALGEVALVVIGILIALQINNWKEEKSNKEIELSFYEDILDDLSKDRAELENIQAFYKNRVEQLGWILQKVRDPESSTDILEFGNYPPPY